MRRTASMTILCGALCASSVAFAQAAPDPAGAPPPETVQEAPPMPASEPPVVAPSPAPSPPPVVVAEASPEADGQMALLFNLNNIFTNGAVLGGWQSLGLGVQRELGNRAFLRAGLNAFRLHDPVETVKTTRINGMMEVVGYELQLPASGFTSQHGVSVVVDYAKRLSDKKLAPYIGGGALAVLVDRRLSYTDDLTVTDQVTDVSQSSSTFGVGIRGILGVRWQLSETFGLFAEYGAVLQAFTRTSDHERTTVTSTASGMPASETIEREAVSTSWFDLDVGLAQGGSLGLIASF